MFWPGCRVSWTWLGIWNPSAVFGHASHLAPWHRNLSIPAGPINPIWTRFVQAEHRRAARSSAGTPACCADRHRRCSSRERIVLLCLGLISGWASPPLTRTDSNETTGETQFPWGTSPASRNSKWLCKSVSVALKWCPALAELQEN